MKCCLPDALLRYNVSTIHSNPRPICRGQLNAQPQAAIPACEEEEEEEGEEEEDGGGGGETLIRCNTVS